MRNSPLNLVETHPLAGLRELLASHSQAEDSEGGMDPKGRLRLAERGTVEIIQRSELAELLEEKQKPRAYWGFEPSGMQAHACTE